MATGMTEDSIAEDGLQASTSSEITGLKPQGSIHPDEAFRVNAGELFTILWGIKHIVVSKYYKRLTPWMTGSSTSDLPALWLPWPPRLELPLAKHRDHACRGLLRLPVHPSRSQIPALLR